MEIWVALGQTFQCVVVILISFGLLNLIELWRINRSEETEAHRAGR